MRLPAIEVSGLAKRYVIEHESQHDNLRDTLHHAARKLWRRARWGTGFEREEFWALRDVTFSVQPGEVVGIIGRNGAGKSTLLKILSRITAPTAGRVTMRGRVASLLEVGTGFHPDLTGRENIFLNGAILGMSRAEIRSRFDEIVAFAEVEKFLDTPVKRYSSGMYVRLAFAVAAHLEPEIFIVDEVLAVGDAAFQRKCLGKMENVARTEGRTVIFVSHNLGALQALCKRAIYLAGGRLVSQGPAPEQILQYNRDLRQATSGESAATKRFGTALTLEEFSFQPRLVQPGGTLEFRLVMSAATAVTAHDVCVLIQSAMGVRVAILDLRCATGSYCLEPGRPLVIEGRVRSIRLVEGDYLVGLYLNTTDFKGDLSDLRSLAVGGPESTREITPYPPHDRGFVELECDFHTS